MTGDAAEQRQQAIDASIGRPFAFEQGGALHVGVLGMVARPSGPHDDIAFVSGIWDGERSQADLDLTAMHDEPGEFVPQLDLWFDDVHTVFDISEAFVGAPEASLEDSGIPPEVLAGPVAVSRAGDAGDGVVALLTQMCFGKMIVPPAAMIGLIASPHLADFASHEVEGIEPLRAFHAVMPVAQFLNEVGLSSTTIINQIAVLGADLRYEVGPHVAALLDTYLESATAQLAWFIDDDGLIQTSQVVVTLNAFLDQIFRSDAVLERLATAENATVEEIREFVDQAAEMGRLAYMNVVWQTYDFDDQVDEVRWPDAADLSDQMAGQASRIKEAAESADEGS